MKSHRKLLSLSLQFSWILITNWTYKGLRSWKTEKLTQIFFFISFCLCFPYCSSRCPENTVFYKTFKKEESNPKQSIHSLHLELFGYLFPWDEFWEISHSSLNNMTTSYCLKKNVIFFKQSLHLERILSYFIP